MQSARETENGLTLNHDRDNVANVELIYAGTRTGVLCIVNPSTKENVTCVTSSHFRWVLVCVVQGKRISSRVPNHVLWDSDRTWKTRKAYYTCACDWPTKTTSLTLSVWQEPMKYRNGTLDCAWQWRHNKRDGVSKHRRLHCLLNRLFRGNQGKNQSSASLPFVRGSRRRQVNSPHKGPITRKMFPFDDVS